MSKKDKKIKAAAEYIIVLVFFTLIMTVLVLLTVLLNNELVLRFEKGDSVPQNVFIVPLFRFILNNLMVIFPAMWAVGTAVISFYYIRKKRIFSEDFTPVSRKRTKRLRRSIMLRFFLTVAGFTAGLFLFVYTSYEVCTSIIWEYNSALYVSLRFIGNNIVLIMIIVWLAGVTFISYRTISRLTSYLDIIVVETGQLLSDKSRPVVLPAEIKSLQDELNLVREQAQNSAQLAKEAEQRKNDLIVYLAHDLKTPLTSVIGYLTLLQDEPMLTPEMRAKYTGIALDKAERLEELINEFFDVTRFNLTAMTLESERISLSRMLEQLKDEFLPILKEKRLTWQAEIEEDVEMICDPAKLERVFDNLIRNAVSYGYRETAIELCMKRVQGGAEIRIKNHGRTIPPEKLELIFQQFFRLDVSRTSSTGGAGLGLAIAKEIVKLHGGTITAESENESVCFTVFLPETP